MSTFAITGILSHPRQHYVDLIESAGGKVSSSISYKVDYLICGAEPGSKLDRARELGVQVVDEEGLERLLVRGLPARDHRVDEPPSSQRVVYYFYTETHGENQAMFDSDFRLLGAWHCNDANWRQEYFGGFMRKLDIKVKDLPDGRRREAIAAICEYLGYDDDEDEDY